MAVAEGQYRIKLKKDDAVEVIAGKDKGKRGKIIKVLRDKNRVLVEGVNMVKKTQKRKNQNDRGGIIEIEAALHSSNVMIVCKKCGPTRVGYKTDGETKKRICRKCKDTL
jgi:large subunit ribosomal protein L24